MQSASMTLPVVQAFNPICVTEGRTRSKIVLVELVHQALDVLLLAEDSRLVHWDGRILRLHKLTSRKARQILQSPEDFPGFLGVFNHKAMYRDIAEPLGDLLGVRL